MRIVQHMATQAWALAPANPSLRCRIEETLNAAGVPSPVICTPQDLLDAQ